MAGVIEIRFADVKRGLIRRSASPNEISLLISRCLEAQQVRGAIPGTDSHARAAHGLLLPIDHAAMQGPWQFQPEFHGRHVLGNVHGATQRRKPRANYKDGGVASLANPRKEMPL